MNLIQIQENLKDMPTQAIMAYANGQNPMVPPYLALGEMNRRKQMEKRSAEPPQGSVKEKLEQELMQPQMPQMPQGAPQGMAPQGMPSQMPPQAAPQMPPRMPPQAAPQMASQMAPQMAPKGMAEGGLTNLPMRSDRFNYAPGGIVSFSDGDLVELPEQEAADVLSKQLKGEFDIPQPVSREEERQALIAKDPSMAAYLNKAPGEAMTGLMSQLQTQNSAQKQQFQQQQSGQGLATLANALLAGAESTRGRKGSGIGEAFLGIGKTYSAAQAAADKRQQEQAAIERAQTIEMAKLQADIDNMQRAFAEGRVEDGMKYKAAVQAREAKIAELQGLSSKGVLTLADTRRQRAEQKRHNEATESLTQQQREEQKRHNEAVERYQGQQAGIAAERAQYERENRPSKDEKQVLAVMTRLNADPQYRSLLKRQEQFGPTDPEFDAIQDALDSIRDAAFADAKLAPPTKRDRLAPVTPAAEPGFFKRLTMTSADREALDWANANPKDPRSAQIKKGLGF